MTHRFPFLFILILIVIIVYLFFSTFDINLSKYYSAKTTNLNDQITPSVYSDILTPSITSIPIVFSTTKKPSERSLKVVVFIYINSLTQIQNKETKEIKMVSASDLPKYGIKNKLSGLEYLKNYYATESATTEEIINNSALYLDTHIEKLTVLESLIEKYKQEAQRNNIVYENIQNDNGLINSFLQYDQTNKSKDILKDFEIEQKQQCQEEINRYTTCMSKYNSEMSEYNTCMTEKVFNEWKICIKPINLCGIKPFCAY